MTLANLLSESQIIPEMAAKERWQAIQELVDCLVASGKVDRADEDAILESIRQREETMSTGIGFGIAQAFIAEGASVVIGNRDEKKGDYALERLKAGGVKVLEFSDDIWDAFGVAAEEVFEETRAHSALATEIDDHFQQKLREIGGTIASLEGTFINQRNRILGIGG